MSWVRIPPEQLFLEKRVVQVSCLALFLFTRSKSFRALEIESMHQTQTHNYSK